MPLDAHASCRCSTACSTASCVYSAGGWQPAALRRVLSASARSAQAPAGPALWPCLPPAWPARFLLVAGKSLAGRVALHRHRAAGLMSPFLATLSSAARRTLPYRYVVTVLGGNLGGHQSDRHGESSITARSACARWERRGRQMLPMLCQSASPHPRCRGPRRPAARTAIGRRRRRPRPRRPRGTCGTATAGSETVAVFWRRESSLSTLADSVFGPVGSDLTDRVLLAVCLPMTRRQDGCAAQAAARAVETITTAVMALALAVALCLLQIASGVAGGDGKPHCGMTRPLVQRSRSR